MFEKKDIGDYLLRVIQNSLPGKISVSLWSKNDDDLFLGKLSSLNISNGISIVLRAGDYVDVFSFAADVTNEDIRNFYLNHIGLLKRFIIYFRFKAKHIINDMARNHVIKLKQKPCFNDDEGMMMLAELRHFKQQIVPKRIVINRTRGEKIILTRKETEYLILMLEGKSIKKIAEELGKSPKTVEAVLQKIKSKTGCSTKTSLFSLLLEQKIYYQPSIFYDRYN